MGGNKERVIVLRDENKTNKDLNELVELYKVDKYLARFKFNYLDKHRFKRLYKALYIKKGHIRCVSYNLGIGFNKNGVMYNYKKNTATYTFTNKGVFVRYSSSQIRLAFGYEIADLFKSEPIVREEVNKIYPTLESLINNINLVDKLNTRNNSLNYFINRKVYKLKDIFKLTFGFDLIPGVRRLIHSENNYETNGLFNVLAAMNKSKHGINKENFDWSLCSVLKKNETGFNLSEYLRLLDDLIMLSNQTFQPVSFSWSVKRMTIEHDRLVVMLNTFLTKCEMSEPLSVNPIFQQFNADSGSKYKLMLTTADLIVEGVSQHNCIGGYQNRVNQGYVGIYHRKGMSIALRVSYTNGVLNTIQINEYKYKYNVNVPDDDPVLIELKEDVSIFNEKISILKNIEQATVPTILRAPKSVNNLTAAHNYDEELPF